VTRAICLATSNGFGANMADVQAYHLRQPHIPRFHITMNDPFAVRALKKRLGYALPNRRDRRVRAPLFLLQLPQAFGQA
jgi:hypothetical protein